MILLQGFFEFVLRDPDGLVVDFWAQRNFITDAGRNHVADRLRASPAQAAMSHMAIGSGTGGTAASTTLVTETARVALAGGSPAGSTNAVTYTASFGAGVGTGTVSEVGVLNASSAGTLLNYASGFTARNKGAGQTLDIVLTVLVTGAPAS